MLMQRTRAAQLVAADFLKAESSVDEAAIAASACVCTMLAQRAAAKLPVTVGVKALELVSQASADLIRARQRFIEAHALLVEARADIGLQTVAYGDESECPPGFTGPMGLAETPARLVAVA